jgi:hypothetical protein
MSIEDIAQLEPDPLETEPRSCELCGLTVDRHDMVDDGDGPLFFCAEILPDEMTLDELERRAALIQQEEVAAIFARLEAMDDPSKRQLPRTKIEPRRPAQSTVAAFWYVVSLDDPDYLAAWLAKHPADAPALLKILNGGR